MSEWEGGGSSMARRQAGGASRGPGPWSWVGRCWVAGVAALLASTALLKLWAGLTARDSLPGHERVFGMLLVSWSWVAGATELVVVVLLLSAPTARWAFQLIRAFFGAVLGYRVLLAWNGGGPCGCVGRLLENSPWQGKEGMLLGGVALAVFLLNEAVAFLGRGAFRRERGAALKAKGAVAP